MTDLPTESEATAALQRWLAQPLDRGRIRASHVIYLAGFSKPSWLRRRIITRVMQELGWERGRFRFGGELAYGFAKGTELERETVLVVVTDGYGGFSLKRKDP